MDKKQLDKLYKKFDSLIPPYADIKIVEEVTKVKLKPAPHDVSPRTAVAIFYKWLRKRTD